MTVLRQQAPLAVAAMPSWGPLSHPLVRDIVVVMAAVVMLAAASQLSIEAPFSRNGAGLIVPFSGQPFAVLLIGAALGWRRGFAALMTYHAVGLMGAPVFAGGSSGMVLFGSASAGYLWGHVVAVFVVGWLAEHGFDRGRWLAATLLLGEVCIYAVGLPVLALWLNTHNLPVSVWESGLWPFVASDLIQVMLAATFIPTAWAAVERFAPRR